MEGCDLLASLKRKTVAKAMSCTETTATPAFEILLSKGSGRCAALLAH